MRGAILLRDYHTVAPVAQLDRAFASGAKGQRFESSRAHHSLVNTKKRRAIDLRLISAVRYTNRSLLDLIRTAPSAARKVKLRNRGQSWNFLQHFVVFRPSAPL